MEDIPSGLTPYRQVSHQTKDMVTAIILGLVLVLLNGIFVANEFALVKLRGTQIEAMEKDGVPGAKVVRFMNTHLNGFLSASQLGITVTSITLGKLSEPAIEHALVEWMGHEVPEWTSAAISIFIITAVHMQLGEMIPKSLALVYPGRTALMAAYPMRVFYSISYPLIWFFNYTSGLVIRLFGLTPPEHHQSSHSIEEIKLLLQQSLAEDRADLLTKAMSLPQKRAEHMLVPRSEVDFLDSNLSLEENLQRAEKYARTRLPLCRQELDDCIGIVDIRDLFWAKHRGETIDLKALAEPVAYFPETISGERLLKEFRERRVQMAIVVDEYGGASGIITPADVVASVMGQLDEDDDDEPELTELPGGRYDVDGNAALDEIKEIIDVDFADTEMRTVSGVLMETLGRMPKAGDIVVAHGLVFTVLKVVGPRIERVRIRVQNRTLTQPPSKT